ncbi:membrane fusion protein (multidrug efflux system) [Dinghuibacter silviterrae]|uniref:Membrane fusion protein (Multidrug efflux system) n=2 Tax=Dinghuibacter silviterrae TaxID=1539049 RepID=A0A4R8DJ29_9BACT|nr:membrane fusion protein (multidrug efflux system) [Dinghuibacter silviterrae]
MNKKNSILTVVSDMKRIIIIPLFLFNFLYSCQNGQPPNSGAAPERYSVLLLATASVSTHKDYPATIQGRQDIEIRPMITGYLATINVSEGAKVNKDQLLFTIKNPQYEQEVRSSEAAVQTADADLATAKMSYAKVKPLVDKQIVSKYELESADYTLRTKEAALAEAKASLENARTNLSYTIIRSPHEGVIGTIPYKIGSLIGSTSSSALTMLSDIRQVYAYFTMDEKTTLGLLKDARAEDLQRALDRFPAVTLVLADGSLYALQGRLKTASGLISSGMGSFTIKAVFDNPQGLLRSGATGFVRIPLHLDSALLVPQSATFEQQDKRLVYVVQPDNRVHAVAITATPTDDGKSFIVSDGLKSGERIVLNGLTTLRDSLLIQPVQ